MDPSLSPCRGWFCPPICSAIRDLSPHWSILLGKSDVGWKRKRVVSGCQVNLINGGTVISTKCSLWHRPGLYIRDGREHQLWATRYWSTTVSWCLSELKYFIGTSVTRLPEWRMIIDTGSSMSESSMSSLMLRMSGCFCTELASQSQSGLC